MEEGIILGIETSTDICSVALFRGGEVVALRESGGSEHARLLAVYIDEALREAGVAPSALDAVAVSAGPGSYTGLRIGVSTAKGVCYALGIPLIAVGSLEALACQIAGTFPEGTLLRPMIDARRMEVYTQLFDHNARPLGEVEAVVVNENSFGEIRGSNHVGMPPEMATGGHIHERHLSLQGQGARGSRTAVYSNVHEDSGARSATQDLEKRNSAYVIFGSGAAKCSEVLPWARYIEVAASARGLVRGATEAFAARRFTDTAYFEPLYLKDFVATTPKKKLL